MSNCFKKVIEYIVKKTIKIIVKSTYKVLKKLIKSNSTESGSETSPSSSSN